jgi:hypothetical protein
MIQEAHLKPGLLVRHPIKPAWGLGKVIHVDDAHANVYFKDIQGSPKDAVKALQLDLALQHLLVAETQSDPVLDNLPPMVHGGRVVTPDRIRLTENQAVDQFVAEFRSFEDKAYLDRERDYKWAAHREVTSRLLSPTGRKLVAGPPSLETATLVHDLCCKKTNLLAKQEVMALNDGLKDHAAAKHFAEANLAFIDNPDDATFTALVGATESLPQVGDARVLSWPTVTLLPYLGDPAKQMFLKPQMTKRTAEILYFDLLYDARPSWAVYQRLIALSEYLLNRLRPLGAKDLIDVQSFMWIVVGSPAANGR